MWVSRRPRVSPKHEQVDEVLLETVAFRLNHRFGHALQLLEAQPRASGEPKHAFTISIRTLFSTPGSSLGVELETPWRGAATPLRKAAWTSPMEGDHRRETAHCTPSIKLSWQAVGTSTPSWPTPKSASRCPPRIIWPCLTGSSGGPLCSRLVLVGETQRKYFREGESQRKTSIGHSTVLPLLPRKPACPWCYRRPRDLAFHLLLSASPCRRDLAEHDCAIFARGPSVVSWSSVHGLPLITGQWRRSSRRRRLRSVLTSQPCSPSRRTFPGTPGTLSEELLEDVLAVLLVLGLSRPLPQRVLVDDGLHVIHRGPHPQHLKDLFRLCWPEVFGGAQETAASLPVDVQVSIQIATGVLSFSASLCRYMNTRSPGS